MEFYMILSKRFLMLKILILIAWVGYTDKVSASTARSSDEVEYLPVSTQCKDLLKKYSCKYIYVIKSRPSSSKKGMFTGLPSQNQSTPISLSLDFKPLDEAYYRGIDLDDAKLFKLGIDGKATPVQFRFTKATQYSGTLKWNGETRDNAVYYFCIPAKVPGKKIKPNCSVPLFMDGGVLRKPGKNTIGTAFYPNCFDINGDGKKDIITGDFHDFIRVYENIAESPSDTPLCSENHTYNLADKDGFPLAHDYFSHGWKVTAPVFYDFNGDGKDDILMGGAHNMGIKVRYWENIGTKELPVYSNRRKIDLKCQDGYKSGGLYPVPCDLNGDGKMDLIAGTMFPGGGDKRYIYFFEGLSSRSDDFKFKPGVRLKDKNGVIKVPGYSNCSVEVFDWNKDGLPDLFAGSAGNLFYWENQGSRTNPVLVKKEFPKLAVGGRISINVIPGKKGNDIISGSHLTYHKNNGNNTFTSSAVESITPPPLAFGGHSTLRILDWNGDGREDIITSNDRGDFYCALADNGTWSKRIPLKSGGKPITTFGCVDPGENNKGYARMALADIDCDGLPDLLVNHERAWRFGYLAFYKGLGHGEFAPEASLPIPRMSHLAYGKGIKGQAAVFDEKTILDYYSYPAKNIFDPAGGEISLSFSPQSNSPYRSSMFLLFNQEFKLDGNKVKYGDVFEVSIDSQGCILWRAGSSFLKTKPVKWLKNKWYKLSFKWGKHGMSIMLGDEVIASNNLNKFQKASGPRIYIGGQQSISFIQKEREYRKRLQYHKEDYKHFSPAYGKIDEVTFKDNEGDNALVLPMDGSNDGFSPKNKQKVPGGSLNIAYRSAPALADLNADGLPDLILSLCPNPNKRDGKPALLYWFENEGTKTKPKFKHGKLLPGKVNAGVRSASRFVDLDGDGDLDLLVMKSGAKLEYYINNGTPKSPKYEYKGIIVDGAWGHESGVDVVDWNHDGQLDIIVTNGDNGNILIYDRQFLDRLSPACLVSEIITPNKLIKMSDQSQKDPLKVTKVYSNQNSDFKVKNISNGIREGGSAIGWWGKLMPVELYFEFAGKTPVSRVDCYWGHPSHALNNPAGSRDPKSFVFEYWTGSNWKPLFPKVTGYSRANELGLSRTASFKFPPKTTDKIRLKIFSSFDNGKRESTPKIAQENERTFFIREIEFY